MSRRAIPPLQRDAVFLLVGGAWGTFTVLTAGPWPIMLISAATMLGPGFLRLWLSGPGMRGNPSLEQRAPEVLPSSSSPGSSSVVPEGDP